jgi:hypothetical protein
MRQLLIALTVTVGFVGFVGPSASAAPPTNKARACVASDAADVQVNRKMNSVAITDDPTTFGNNFGCYTNIPVAAGDTITFSYTGACGGGVPRLFVQFADGSSENTFDTGTCVDGVASYTLVNSGTITSFAFINDRGDGATVTYSDLVIDGNLINF